MTDKHTPGPWKPQMGSYSVFAQGWTVVHGNPQNPNRDSDARLIAAAPDLLEALKEARNVLKLTAKFDRLVDACDAAIAKATGGVND